MKRAARWLLGLPAPSLFQDEPPLPTQTILVSSAAHRALMHHLEARGRWQGGALFGNYVDRSLQVTHITRLGPPGDRQHPLTPCLPYLIGATDMLTATAPGADWRGQWLAAPDSRLPSLQVDLRWLALGAQGGQFDEWHPLLVIGLHEGRLMGRTYTWDEGEAVAIDCPLNAVLAGRRVQGE